VADAVDDANRGRAVALHQLAGDLGQIIGPPLAGALAAGLGFGPAFALTALPTLAVALWAARVHLPVPVERGALPPPSGGDAA
jgi:predicted MFS family arabinose efflux permease